MKNFVRIHTKFTECNKNEYFFYKKNMNMSHFFPVFRAILRHTWTKMRHCILASITQFFVLLLVLGLYGDRSVKK